MSTSTAHAITTPSIAAKPMFDLEQAQQYVSKKAHGLHKIDRKHMLARCIDGRCPANHKGGIAMAGGDEGLLYAALAAANKMHNAGIDFSDEDIRDAVFKTVSGKKNFRYHTDTHVDAAHEIEGCGHCNAALHNPVAYGVSENQVEFIKQTIGALRGIARSANACARNSRGIMRSRRSLSSST